MKNKLFTAVLTLLLIIGSIIPTFAQNHVNTITIDGNTISLPYDVIITEKYILFPVRSLFGTLSFDVEWDDGSVRLIRNDDVIIIPIGSSEFNFNGQYLPIETPARIIENRAFAPISNLLAAIEYDWGISFSIRTIEAIREDEVAINNTLHSLFLDLVAQDIIRNLDDEASLDQDEITETINSVLVNTSNLFEYYGHFIDTDLFMILWDIDGTVYTTLQGELQEMVIVSFAAGAFEPHEATFYYSTNLTMAIGFNRVLNEMFQNVDVPPSHQYHIVVSGDTFSGIAYLYFGRINYDVINLILDANDGVYLPTLQVGQVLIIPFLKTD